MKGGGVKYEVEERKREIKIKSVNVSVFRVMKCVKRDVMNGVSRDINGATRKITEWELLFLWTKISD